MDQLARELGEENERLRKAVEKLSTRVAGNEEERWKHIEGKVDKILVLLVGNEDESASKRAVFTRIRCLEEDVQNIQEAFSERAKKRHEENQEKRIEVSGLRIALWGGAPLVLWEIAKAVWEFFKSKGGVSH